MPRSNSSLHMFRCITVAHALQEEGDFGHNFNFAIPNNIAGLCTICLKHRQAYILESLNSISRLYQVTQSYMLMCIQLLKETLGHKCDQQTLQHQLYNAKCLLSTLISTHPVISGNGCVYSHCTFLPHFPQTNMMMSQNMYAFPPYPISFISYVLPCCAHSLFSDKGTSAWSNSLFL